MLLKWMFILKKAYLLKSTAFEEKGHDEINIMECQWSEGLYKQGIFRLFQKSRCRYILHTGKQGSARAN